MSFTLNAFISVDVFTFTRDWSRYFLLLNTSEQVSLTSSQIFKVLMVTINVSLYFELGDISPHISHLSTLHPHTLRERMREREGRRKCGLCLLLVCEWVWRLSVFWVLTEERVIVCLCIYYMLLKCDFVCIFWFISFIESNFT